MSKHSEIIERIKKLEEALDTNDNPETVEMLRENLKVLRKMVQE